jgi:hypothetical protein
MHCQRSIAGPSALADLSSAYGNAYNHLQSAFLPTGAGGGRLFRDLDGLVEEECKRGRRPGVCELREERVVELTRYAESRTVNVRHVWRTLVARLAIGDNEVLKQGGDGVEPR